MEIAFISQYQSTNKFSSNRLCKSEIFYIDIDILLSSMVQFELMSVQKSTEHNIKSQTEVIKIWLPFYFFALCCLQTMV